MFKKKITAILFVFILAAFTLVGCIDNRPASKILQDALNKNTEITSYAFDGAIELNLEFSKEMLDAIPPEEQLILEFFKNAKILYKGAAQLDPLQFEMILSMDVNFGDISTNISIPILMNEENLWIKVPNIPGVPELEGIAGKFIEMNFKELSALSGEEVPNFTANIQTQTKLSQEFLSIFFKHFDESYFAKVDVKNLSLPESVKAKSAVEFKITQENFKDIITIVLDKVAPEVIDLMAKPEYQEITQLTPELAEQAKNDIQNSKAELDTFMAEFNQYVTIQNGSLIFVEDKEGYIRHQKVNVVVDVKPEEKAGTIHVGLTATQNMHNINGTQTFENSFPPAQDQVVPFMNMFGSLMGVGFNAGTSFDVSTDFAESDELLAQLQAELLNQEWFYSNEEITTLLDTNEEFYNDLNNIEILSGILYDEAYRAEFFAYYGIELPVEE